VTDAGGPVTEEQPSIAVVGMAGRFPGAASVPELWRNLMAGRVSIRDVTDEELAAAGVGAAELADPAYVRRMGPLADFDLFDAGLFGISPWEAERMDPQHRLFLECCWEALQDAGQAPRRAPELTGVFAGSAFPQYAVTRLLGGDAVEVGNIMQIAVGNDRDSLTSQVSYRLGLKGPSVTVQSFCSTSLVAVHLAGQSLLTYECDLALAGGVSIELPQPAGYRYEQGGFASPDGVCRSLDADANGTVYGSAVGVVVLKRTADALRDQDRIYAVIRGSACNNDGGHKAGYTAPAVSGQAEVMAAALAVADVPPETIGYVECHATGTLLGDSVELAAMERVFGDCLDGPRVLASLKPHLGHTDRASGVAGLIRACLAVREGVLPGTAHFRRPNPAMPAPGHRFTVLPAARPWPAGPRPRRAGVSSFGLGGTNAHVVLEQAPVAPDVASAGARDAELLLLSAHDETALQESAAGLRRHLEADPSLAVGDVAFTLRRTQRAGVVRQAVVCGVGRVDCLEALGDPGRWRTGRPRRRDPGVVLQLSAAESTPPSRWEELRRAVPALGDLVPEPVRTADGCRQMQYALGKVLARAGVPLADVDTDDAAEDVAMRLRQEERLVGRTGDELTLRLAPPATGSALGWLLDRLAELWIEGVDLTWTAFDDASRRVVSLPPYAFQRRRYWLDAVGAPDRDGAAAAPEAGPGPRRLPIADWLSRPTWQEEPRIGDAPELREAGDAWLVLGDGEFVDSLVRTLVDAPVHTTHARSGAAFDRRGNDDFEVRTDSAEDLRRLLSSLEVVPDVIVHAFSVCAAAGDFDAAQDAGFHSVVALVEALAQTPSAGSVQLVLLTSGAVPVTGPDLTNPEHATMSALRPVIIQEHPGLAVRHIDVGPPTGAGAGGVAALVDDLLTEITAAGPGPVALRGGNRWTRRFAAVPTDPQLPQRGIDDGDTVLITGGLGDVGLVLAEHLARTRSCNLVLVTRSGLPPRAEWARLLRATDPDDRVAERLRTLCALERDGHQVLAMSADVADEAGMAAVIAAARDRFGGVDAVIHGAGVSDPAFFSGLADLDRAAADAHFRAKVHGLRILDRLLGADCTGPRIVLSSLSALLGGIALGAYAAANAALDACVRDLRMHGGGHWVTADWETWRIREEQHVMPGTSVAEFAMTPEEGTEVFVRLLSLGGRVPHLVVSSGSIAARMSEWVDRPAPADDLLTGGLELLLGAERHPRPDLLSPYVPPSGSTQETLCRIWSATLGIADIGIDDDFFELGGHSLAAMRLIELTRRELGVHVPVTALMERRSVRRLATALQAGDSPVEERA